MATELTMPALSPTMEKGNLAKWLVKPGDVVKLGDLVAEIETDKATMEFEATAEGVVTQIVVPDGSEDVAVGEVLALLGESGDVVVPSAAPAAAIPSETAEARPVKKPLSVSAPAHVSEKSVAPSVFDSSIRATPLAKRIASIMGISLDQLKGSGPNGKIVKADLGLAPLASSATQPSPASALPAQVIAPPPHDVPVETVKLSGMRKTIARRLTESKQAVPHFYLTSRCNLDPLLGLRAEINAALAGRNVKISVNDMLMKALALALVEVPDANVQFGGDVLHRFGRVDISMAVAIDGGLVTPVIKGVDTLSLSAIAARSKELATRARSGKLTPDDYQGGTVSLSNLGMFGIDEMVPVINPPQGLIVGAAAGIRQPWNVDGEIKLATILALTASFDHRAIDGAVAAEFMKTLRFAVENPWTLAA